MFAAKITLNDKCLFSQPEIKFLGHVINASGIKPDKNKEAVIVEIRATQKRHRVEMFTAPNKPAFQILRTTSRHL